MEVVGRKKRKNFLVYPWAKNERAIILACINGHADILKFLYKNCIIIQ
jgi:hypothetical protein